MFCLSTRHAPHRTDLAWRPEAHGQMFSKAEDTQILPLLELPDAVVDAVLRRGIKPHGAHPQATTMSMTQMWQ